MSLENEPSIEEASLESLKPDIIKSRGNLEASFTPAGLNTDVLNSLPRHRSDPRETAPHYGDYFKTKYPEEIAERIIRKSSPEKIKEYDALIDQRNAQHREGAEDEILDGYADKLTDLVWGE